MKEINLYTGSIGLNNKVASHRLKYSIENGVSGLEEAINVLIDRTGEIVARRGYNKKIDGNFHSLFPGDDWGLVAKDRQNDTAIYQVIVSGNGNVTLTGIRDGLDKGKRIDFCRVMDAIFYTNGNQTGMITTDSISVPWKQSEWPDEKSNVVWSAPPAMDHLGYNAGRIYFSIGNVLYYTEFGMLGLYDEATNVEQFPDRIIMIIPAQDGLYVSTEKAIYFLEGLNPHEWTNKKVADYPALEWGKHHNFIDPSFIGLETNIPSMLIATVNGPVICLPGGQIVNLIDKKITLPDCTGKGAIVLYDETLILQVGE